MLTFALIHFLWKFNPISWEMQNLRFFHLWKYMPLALAVFLITKEHLLFYCFMFIRAVVHSLRSTWLL